MYIERRPEGTRKGMPSGLPVHVKCPTLLRRLINPGKFLFSETPADGSGIFGGLTEVFRTWNGDNKVVLCEQPVKGYLGNGFAAFLSDGFERLQQGFDFAQAGGTGHQAAYRR